MARLPSGAEARQSRWLVGAVSFLLAAAAEDGLRAQTPTVPANQTAMLAKARQLQHDGDIRAAQQIAETELKQDSDQSHVAGSLELLTLIYKQSGRYDQALATGTRYQKLLEKIPNADASKRQDIDLMLAEVLAGLGKYPQAIAHVDDALKIAGGWRATDPLWEPHAFALRAQIERAAGQVDAAAKDWREVESRMQGVLGQVGRTGPNTDLEESALKLLTEALVSTGRTAEAIAVREQFLARHEDDQTRARNWSEIANCYAQLGQDSKEEQSLLAALNLETTHEQRRSQAEVADLLDRLGLVLENRGDLDGARSRWKEAATIYQRLVDGRTRYRSRSEQNLGYLAKLEAIFEHLHQWPEAIRVQQQLLETRSQTWLPEDPKLWRIKSTLGSLYARAREADKAQPLLVDALAYWRSRVPVAANEISQTLIQLSKVATIAGDRKQAIAHADGAVKACQPPAGHELQLAEAYDSLGDALAADRQNDKAVEQYNEAVQICRERRKERRANTILCGSLVEIATVYKAQREYRRAAEYCAQALDVRRQMPSKDALALIGLHTALATLQLADDQTNTGGKGDPAELAEAEKNIEAARRLCEERGLLDGPAGIGVLELEAIVEVRHDKPDAARKSFDAALSLARRSRLSGLEAKLRTELAELDQRYGSATGTDLPTKP